MDSQDFNSPESSLNCKAAEEGPLKWSTKRKHFETHQFASPEEREVADILLMMAAMPPRETHSPPETPPKPSYERHYGKTFSSLQALGSHKFSHRQKPTTLMPIEEAAAVSGESSLSADCESIGAHVCKTCSKSFPTGQALGGHMRLHYEGPIGGKSKSGNSIPNGYNSNTAITSQGEGEGEGEVEDEKEGGVVSSNKPRLIFRLKIARSPPVHTQLEIRSATIVDESTIKSPVHERHRFFKS